MSKITAYAALAAAQYDDVLPVVDVDDATMAPSGTTKKITVAALTARLAPSGDTTGATDTATINAVAQAGGIAQLQAGTYYVTNLLPDSLGVIAGVGAATKIQAVAGTAGYMVALKTPASTYRVTIKDLTLIPATGSLGGILLDNTGWTSGGGETDPLHVLDGVYVQNAGGDGFHFGANARGLRVTRCAQYSSGGAGFWLESGCTDSAFTSCISGPSQGHGWVVAGWNNYFSSCKGFFSGWNGSAFDTTHNAWEITGKYNTLASCSAQNGALHGFDLNGCANCALTGCEADNNNSGGTTGVGINTNGATFCTVIGCTGDTGQLYGIQVAGTQTNTTFFGNTITGATGPFNYVSGGGYMLVDPGSVDLSGQNVQFSNVDIKVAGSGLQVAEGSNCKQGTAVLVAGSKVVSNTAVTANSRIFLTSNADGGTPGWLRVSARTAGTSFTIASSSASDTSTVAYEIFEPG